MSKEFSTGPGRSLFFFSFWVLICGAVLTTYPFIMLEFLSVPRNAAIVARIFGMVLLFFGYYYLRAGLKGDMYDFYRWTVHGRFAALVISSLFVVLRFIGPVLFAFIAVDVLGALWTLLALRRYALRRYALRR